MEFATENALEMQRKRGRPKKEDESAPIATGEVVQAEEKPKVNKDRLVPLILKAGWWPVDGTVYYEARFVPIGRGPDGRPMEKVVYDEKVYETPMHPNGGVDEMKRKHGKLNPGTMIMVKMKYAKVLIDAGKATLNETVDDED